MKRLVAAGMEVTGIIFQNTPCKVTRKVGKAVREEAWRISDSIPPEKDERFGFMNIVKER